MNFQEMFYRITEGPGLIQKLTVTHAKGKWPKYLLGGLMVFFFTNWLPSILSYFIPLNYWDLVDEQVKEAYANMVGQTPQLPIVPMIYMLLFVGVFEVGQALYVLTFIRNGSCEYRSIFEGFVLFGKAIGLSIVRSIFISMGLFFFIAPGVLFFYHFRQAYFILADDPSKGIMQCLAESRMRMTGNKMNMFRLDLSYIGIIAVGYFPSYLVDYFQLLDQSTLAGMLGYFVLEIPLALALSYCVLVRGVYYELLVYHGFDNFKFQGEEVFRNYRLVLNENANEQ